MECLLIKIGAFFPPPIRRRAAYHSIKKKNKHKYSPLHPPNTHTHTFNPLTPQSSENAFTLISAVKRPDQKDCRQLSCSHLQMSQTSSTCYAPKMSFLENLRTSCILGLACNDTWPPAIAR